MYFTLLCCSLLQFSGFIGFLTYKPKYMEQQYGQSTSKSNFLIGELHCEMTVYAISSAWGEVLHVFSGTEFFAEVWRKRQSILNLNYRKAAYKLLPFGA